MGHRAASPGADLGNLKDFQPDIPHQVIMGENTSFFRLPKIKINYRKLDRRG
jgi:hypothetical protein